MTIQAITFDFWSTLYQNAVVDDAQRLQGLKEKVEACCGASFAEEQFLTAVKTARSSWTRAWRDEHRTISAEEWLQTMLAVLKTSLRPEDLLRIKTGMEESVLVHRPTLVAEARPALAALSTRFRLAIISDTGITPGRVLRQILEEDGVIGYFTQLTFSDEVGYSKPHPAAFLTTLQALAIRPDEAVHVGDLLRTDIAGAQAVGMRAVQYVGLQHDDGAASLVTPGLMVRPDAVIKSHTELKPLLTSWNGRG